MLLAVVSAADGRCTLGGMRRIVLMVLALALAGCPPPPRPPFELHSMRVMQLSPQGVSMSMFVRVNNNHPFDVKVRNVRANVVIAHQFQLPPVQYNPEQWLGADASTIVQVPVLIPWAMIRPLVLVSAGSPVIDYRVTGLIDVTAVRMLGIRVNDHAVDLGGRMSRAELLGVVGRSVPTPW
jgi:hypothetical protein